MKENRKVSISEKKNTCILWTTAISDIINPTSDHIGGISVQMYFWANTFMKNGWDVHSFYSDKNTTSFDTEGIIFHKDFVTHLWSAVLYFFFTLYIFIKVKPNLIITRGGTNRNLLFISFIAKCFKTTTVHFIASDKELTLKNGTLANNINRSCFLKGIRNTKFIVAQNEFQEAQLLSLFNRKSLIIPNIWGEIKNAITYRIEDTDILWVANIKSLKRPTWVFDLAKKMPNVTFTIIGGDMEHSLFEICNREADSLPNLHFLGAKSFRETNEYFKHCRLFLCTSEYEGFPNTFLQAWSNNVPIVSTVNPNNVLNTHNTGIFCRTIEELSFAIDKCLSDNTLYHKKVEAINSYFTYTHAATTGYNKLINYIKKSFCL